MTEPTDPPGRPDVGQAMRTGTQCQPGLPRTSTPQQTVRHVGVRAPALRLGIAIARSLSTRESHNHANAAAWAIAAAADTARHAQSTIAIVTFGTESDLVDTNSSSDIGVTATEVLGAANRSADLSDALKLLRHRLKLELHPGDSRLLVVISDTAPACLERVELSVISLIESGGCVLWVSIDEDRPADLPAGITAVGVSSTDLMRTLPAIINDVLATLPSDGSQ